MKMASFLSLLFSTVIAESIDQVPRSLECSLKAFDVDSCQSTQSSGKPCVWCEYKDTQLGICVTPEEAEKAKEFSDDGVHCLAVEFDNFVNVGLVDLVEEDDEFIQGEGDAHDEVMEFLHCVEAGGTDRHICESTSEASGKKCSFCTKEGIQGGVCVTQDAVAAFIGKFLDCDSGESSPFFLRAAAPQQQQQKQEVEGPFDIACLTASGSDDSKCSETSDADGQSCVWCDAKGTTYGVCLNAYQAKILPDSFEWVECPGGDNVSGEVSGEVALEEESKDEGPLEGKVEEHFFKFLQNA